MLLTQPVGEGLPSRLDEPFYRFIRRSVGEGRPDRARFQYFNGRTAMRNTGADWQMNVYGCTVHSFTNDEAAKRNMPEVIRYSEPDARGWASALDLFALTWVGGHLGCGPRRRRTARTA
jgi:hypothetical protein